MKKAEKGPRRFRLPVVIICMVLVTAVTVTTAFATVTQQNATPNTAQDPSYKEKLDRLEWHDRLELDSIPIQDTYSYDEMAAYLEDNGLTQQEALDFMGERPAEEKNAAIRYVLFGMTRYAHKGNYQLQLRTIAGLEYPEGSVSPNRIVSLGGAYVSTDGGRSCLFDETIFCVLAAGNNIYYNFYGTIYQEARSVDLRFGPGGLARVNFTLSLGERAIAFADHNETYFSAALER